MRRSWIAILILGAAAVAGAPAQSFFTPAPRYVTPSWRGAVGTEFSRWDVLSSPYGDPLAATDGYNFPDLAAPNGTRTLASVTGFTPPANADPADPLAYWHAANPTLRQTATPNAFIIGAGTAGNLYSFAAVTGYEVADATPFPAGSVVFQWQTDGQLLNFTSLRLVAGGVEYAPANFISEFRFNGAGFGGITNRAAAQWNLTGLGVTSYAIRFHSESSSTSFQEALLDTAPTYLEAVPSDRDWTAASGAWSEAAHWSPGSLPPVGGNVRVGSAAALTVDGGVREIGELRLSAPDSSTFGAGGGTLQLNTGISATPAAPATYVVAAPVTMGAYNIHSLNAHTTVICDGAIGGTVGFYLTGAGTLQLNAANTFTGASTVESGATLSGSGSIAARLSILGRHAPGAGIGTMTHAGQLAYGATAHLSWQLGASTSVVGSFDQVAAAAVTVAAGARVELVFDPPGGAVDFREMFWRSARAWPVLTSSSLSGVFALGAITDDALGNVPANYGIFSLTHAATGVTLHWTPLSSWEVWRRASFGTQWNDAAIAGELVDAETDGLRNVVEYALAGDGAAATAPPQIGKAANRLTLTFPRNAAATDTTLTVRGADSPAGPWTDLAQSVDGAPPVALVAGVSVAESGSAAVPVVEVRDLHLLTDPAHPRRFLRLEVTRHP